MNTKILLAISAVCAAGFAATCKADISSANIVGYSGFTLRSGSIMVSPAFLNVGGSSITRLTDIKPTGYENLAYWKTGKGNGFNDKITVAVLAKDGATADDPKVEGKKLIWAWKHAKGFANPGYWVRLGESTAITPGSADDYQFKLGEAVWANVVAGAYGGSTGAGADQYKLEFPAVEDDNRVTE